MSNNNSNLEEKYILNFLVNTSDSYVPWIQRKETASWTAVVFTSTVYAFLFNFLTEHNSHNITKFDFCTITLPLLFFDIIFTIVLFAFIHSQFSSIHHYSAYFLALRNIIYGIFKDKHLSQLNFDIDQETKLPIFLNKEFKKQRDFIQPYLNKNHPCKILQHFWSFDWIRKKENRKKENFTNYAKQEAAIYSLLILFNIVFLSFVIRLGYLTFCK